LLLLLPCGGGARWWRPGRTPGRDVWWAAVGRRGLQAVAVVLLLLLLVVVLGMAGLFL
jgi:hypothetical protein